MSSHTTSDSHQLLTTEEELPLRLDVRVPRGDLKSSPNNALIKSGFFSRLRNHLPLFRLKRISVKSSFHDTEDTVLYCPETSTCTDTRANPTQFIRVDPRTAQNLVRRDDDFEVSFIGISATPYDVGRSNDNELLLYSLINEDLCDEICHVRRDIPIPSTDPSTSMEPVHVPTGIPQTSDLPFIHYDPVIDGHDKGTQPDSFVPIPASKRLYYRHRSGANGDRAYEQVFNVRFTLMEIDKISDILARAPSNVDQLGSYVSQTAGAVPYMELVAKAIHFASEFGKQGIKQYARPDHVLSTDAEFLLAEPEGGLPQKDGDYLRYGYYYFLNKPVDAQVYVQTCSSSQHMPLMMKRENLTLKRAHSNEKLFFPLTGVSYLVMKVSKGCKNHGFNHTRSIHDEHKKRLENMIQMRCVLQMVAGMNGSGKNSRKSMRN